MSRRPALHARASVTSRGERAPDPEDSQDVLSRVLEHWKIDRFRVRRRFGGTSRSSWLIETPEGMHVLRKVATEREYLDYQVRVIHHLASSDFPYAVPAILAPNDAAQYVMDDEGFWLVYRFIEGRTLPSIATPRAARALGALVGHFDHSIEGLDLGPSTGHFHLPLFEPDLGDRLDECRRWLSSRQDRTLFGNEDLDHLHSLQVAWSHIPPTQIEEARKLPRITVYNDWHSGNILYRWPRIRGLIDFDSLVEAPRIVDFQNALTWVLVGHVEPDPDLLSAFSGGYQEISPLSPHEVSLLYPVMLDRIAWLATDILEEMRRGGTSTRYDLAVCLIRLSIWITDYKDSALRGLQAHARQSRRFLLFGRK